MAGVLLPDILGDSRSAKCCIKQYKIVSKIGPGRSPKRRVRNNDLFYARNIFQLFFYWRKYFREFVLNFELQDFVLGAKFGEVGG